MNVGPTEIIIVLVVALLVFGPKRLPQMGRSLGRGVREFRKAADELKDSFSPGDDATRVTPPPPPSAAPTPSDAAEEAPPPPPASGA